MMTCLNCKRHCVVSYDGFLEPGCMDYEMYSGSDEDAMKLAANCPSYDYGSQEYWDNFFDDYNERRHTSSYCGDYGPSNPWDAPGMSISDFI